MGWGRGSVRMRGHPGGVSQRAVSFWSVSRRSEGGELQPVKLWGDLSRVLAFDFKGSSHVNGL